VFYIWNGISGQLFRKNLIKCSFCSSGEASVNCRRITVTTFTLMSRSALLNSSLTKKYWMAATGLFLCLFLLGHLAGNLQLFIPGDVGRLQFNEYARFMTSNPAVKILSYVTYVSILFHAIDGLILSIGNRKARPVRYAMEKASANAAWSSRNMGVLGTVILAFIVMHMQNFWYQMHWGQVGVQTAPDGSELKDLHTVVLAFFDPSRNSWAFGAVLLYVLAQAAIAFHLNHGFSSAFQSLGARHPKYYPIIQTAGKLFSYVVPAAFAAIPVYLFISQS